MNEMYRDCDDPTFSSVGSLVETWRKNAPPGRWQMAKIQPVGGMSLVAGSMTMLEESIRRDFSEIKYFGPKKARQN